MESFPSNSNKETSKPKNAPEKKVEKVVTGEVVSKKKPFGSRMHDIFFGGDSRSALSYIATEVLLPAFRNMLVDATTKGVERIIYGDVEPRRSTYGDQGRVQYHNPTSRYSPRHPYEASRNNRSRPSTRYEINDLIFASGEEADKVLDQMRMIIDQYDFATVSDLNELCGLPSSHTDVKWGWSNLRYAQIRQMRTGFLIDFPPLEPN